jgi:hypothetical protein
VNNSGGTAEVLPNERKNATFVTETMINTVDGSPEITARRRFIISPSEGSDASGRYYWDRATHMREHLSHFLDVNQQIDLLPII